MFNLTKNVLVSKLYPEFGMMTEGGEESRIVTYEAQALSSLSQNTGVAIFSVKIEGVDAVGTLSHTFTYSGTGAPLAEAEESLLKELSAL